MCDYWNSYWENEWEKSCRSEDQAEAEREARLMDCFFGRGQSCEIHPDELDFIRSWDRVVNNVTGLYYWLKGKQNKMVVEIRRKHPFSPVTASDRSGMENLKRFAELYNNMFSNKEKK